MSDRRRFFHRRQRDVNARAQITDRTCSIALYGLRDPQSVVDCQAYRFFHVPYLAPSRDAEFHDLKKKKRKKNTILENVIRNGIQLYSARNVGRR